MTTTLALPVPSHIGPDKPLRQFPRRRGRENSTSPFAPRSPTRPDNSRIGGGLGGADLVDVAMSVMMMG